MVKPRGPGRRFKKGHPGGPGRPPIPLELKFVKKLSMDQVASLGSSVLTGDVAAIREVAISKTEPVLKVAFAAILLDAIVKRDVDKLNACLDRIVGKIPQAMIVAPVTPSAPPASERTPETIKQEAKALLADLSNED